MEVAKLQTPTLQLILGPVFSEKTTEAIRIAKKYARYFTVLFVNPVMDIRSSNGTVEARSGMKWTCTSVTHLKELEANPEFHIAKLIVVDESAFYPDLFEHVSKWCDAKSYVVTGLDGDWKQEKIGQIWDLIPIADKVEKVLALCEICGDGTSAVCSKATRPLDSQVSVVDQESKLFIPVCRKHRN